MTFLEDNFEDKSFDKALRMELDYLVSLGYVEIVGIDDEQEWLYRPTEAGIKFAMENRSFPGFDGPDE